LRNKGFLEFFDKERGTKHKGTHLHGASQAAQASSCTTAVSLKPGAKAHRKLPTHAKLTDASRFRRTALQSRHSDVFRGGCAYEAKNGLSPPDKAKGLPR